MATSGVWSSAVLSNITEITVGCPYFGGDKQKCDIILAVKRTLSAVSVVGCLFVIFVIWFFRTYLAFTQRLVLYLNIATLVSSIAHLMEDHYPDGAVCEFNAWAFTFTNWTVLSWACCITFNIYMNALRMTATDRFERAYHLVCWGFPLVISCLPFIGSHYGQAGLWCWITDDWRWRFGIWYVPLFILIGALFINYIYIIIMVNRKLKTWEGLYDPEVQRKKQLLKEDVQPLIKYPFVYLAVSLFPLVNRIQNAVGPEPMFTLVLLHALSSPSKGALNAIVFGLDKEISNRLTPSQIKIAFRERRERNPDLIQEHPTLPSVFVTHGSEGTGCEGTGSDPSTVTVKWEGQQEGELSV